MQEHMEMLRIVSISKSLRGPEKKKKLKGRNVTIASMVKRGDPYHNETLS